MPVVGRGGCACSDRWGGLFLVIDVETVVFASPLIVAGGCWLWSRPRSRSCLGRGGNGQLTCAEAGYSGCRGGDGGDVLQAALREVIVSEFSAVERWEFFEPLSTAEASPCMFARSPSSHALADWSLLACASSLDPCLSRRLARRSCRQHTAMVSRQDLRPQRG